MDISSPEYISALRNRNFFIFLTSHFLQYVGDALQLVAATIHIFNLTGSGLYAGISLLCTPLLSIILSNTAGSIGDRFLEKKWMAVINIAKGIALMLLVESFSVMGVYIVLLILNSLNILFNPPDKKMTAKLLKDRELIAGNSLLVGVSGFSYLIGPFAGGVVVNRYGIDVTLIGASILFILSGLMLLTINSNGHAAYKSMLQKTKSIKEGYEYYRSMKNIRDTVITGTFVCFGTSCVNLAFYPFAFDVLRVSDREWGLILSIFYGTGIIAMALSISLEHLLNKYTIIFIYISALAMSIVWFSYPYAGNIKFVLFLMVFEGTAYSLCSILLVTRLQYLTCRNYTARIIGINDYMNSIGKLAGILCSYMLLKFLSPGAVFAVNSIIFLIFVLYGLVRMIK